MDAKDITEKLNKIANSEVGRMKLPYFKPFTQGLASIVQFTLKEVESLGGATFFLEAAIDTSDVTDPRGSPDTIGNRVTNNFLISHPKKKVSEIHFKETKRFMLCSLNMREEQVSAEDMSASLNDARGKEQPLRGIQFAYRVEHRETLNPDGSKKIGDYVKFFPAPEQTAEQVAKNRERLGKTHPVTE